MSGDTRDFVGRYNACYTDLAVKTLTGLLLGRMTGHFFLKQMMWVPTAVGAGIGIGMAYMNCETSLNSYLMSLEPKPCNVKKNP